VTRSPWKLAVGILLLSACAAKIVFDVVRVDAGDLANAAHRNDFMNIGLIAIFGSAYLGYHVVRALRPPRDPSDSTAAILTGIAGFVAAGAFSVTIADWRVSSGIYFAVCGIVWDGLALGMLWLLAQRPREPISLSELQRGRAFVLILRVCVLLFALGQSGVAIAGALRVRDAAMTDVTAAVGVATAAAALALTIRGWWPAPPGASLS